MAQLDITTSNAAFNFDTTALAQNGAVQVDSNHFVLVNSRADQDGFAQTFSVNTSTWAISTASSTLEFDTGFFEGPSDLIMIDSTHFIFSYTGPYSDGFIRVLSVDTTTWAISAASVLEYDPNTGVGNNLIQIDTNHFLGLYDQGSTAGYANIYEVNTNTWAISTAHSTFTFYNNYNGHRGLAKLDANHIVVCFYGAGQDGFAQVLAVNTSTWAISTANSVLEFDTDNGQYNNTFFIDSTHFINMWKSSSKYVGQIFAVNTSTWAISTASNVYNITADSSYDYEAVDLGSNKYLVVWRQVTTNDGFAVALSVNTSTWAITTGTAFEFNTDYAVYINPVKIDASHCIIFYTQTTGGNADVLSVEVTPPVVTKTATIQAKSRIKTAGLAKTTQAKARLKTAGLAKTIQSKGRVKVLGSSKTSQAKSRLKTINIVKISQAKARLKTAGLAKTSQAKSRIKTVSLAKTTQVKARLKQIGIASLVSVKSMIRSATTKTISAKAYLLTLGNIKRITAKADIKNVNIAKTSQAKSRIKTAGLAKTTQAKARLKTTDLSQTAQARGRINVTTPAKTIQTKVRVKSAGVSKTIQSKGNIKVLGVSKTSQAKSRIKTAGLAKTTQAKARLKTTDLSQTAQSKGSVKVADVSKDIRARVNIKQLGLGKTIAAKAKIWAFRSGYVKMERGTYPKTLNDNRKI